MASDNEWHGDGFPIDEQVRGWIEEQLMVWAENRDSLKERGNRKQALYYQGKLSGAFKILDLLVNNPHYLEYIREHFVGDPS